MTRSKQDLRKQEHRGVGASTILSRASAHGHLQLRKKNQALSPFNNNFPTAVFTAVANQLAFKTETLK